MSKIFVLSGTTEGRKFSDCLALAGMEHIVSVASQYGKSMMEELPFRTTHVGRMDESDMAVFLKENGFERGDYLIDATHPYATEVSVNAKAVSEKFGLSYYRIKREKMDLSGYQNVKIYETFTECAGTLCDCTQNILLTTGSKEMETYANTVSAETLKNTYVRILPTLESIEICKSYGVEESHIIALQGPFGEELNEALIRQFAIRHLITKESGKEGGFEEKIKACANTGVTVHVIARPDEEGISVKEALQVFGVTGTPEDAECELILAGAGMGDLKNLTVEVSEAIQNADVVFGAKRITAPVRHDRKYPYYRAEDVLKVLNENSDMHKAVVLFSGDSGFYSGAKSFQRDLEKSGYSGKVRILPGISCVSYFASRLGVSFEDATVYSLHGRFSKEALYELGDLIDHSDKTFVLFSGAEEVRGLAKELSDRQIRADVILGIDLSSENEKIMNLLAEDVLSFDGTGSITGCVRNKSAKKKNIVPMLSDDDFIRDKVPMTKEVIRHESIRRLRLCEGDLVYDIGGGTGSVAIEIGHLNPSLKVVTIEKNKDAVLLLQQNVQALHAGNVSVSEGDACDILPGLDKPDCVFIGGSGGRLKEIINILLKKGNGIRYVLNAVTMETMQEIEEIIKEYRPADLKAEQIGVSSLDAVGSYHMLKAQNPVMIYSFTI